MYSTNHGIRCQVKIIFTFNVFVCNRDFSCGKPAPRNTQECKVLLFRWSTDEVI